MTENEIETDFIDGEEVPRPDIDTVRRWLARARAEGRIEGMREAWSILDPHVSKMERHEAGGRIKNLIAAALRERKGGDGS